MSVIVHISPASQPAGRLDGRLACLVLYIILHLFWFLFSLIAINKMGVKTMKIELSMHKYADLALQIEICLWKKQF